MDTSFNPVFQQLAVTLSLDHVLTDLDDFDTNLGNTPTKVFFAFIQQQSPSCYICCKMFRDQVDVMKHTHEWHGVEWCQLRDVLIPCIVYCYCVLWGCNDPFIDHVYMHCWFIIGQQLYSHCKTAIENKHMKYKKLVWFDWVNLLQLQSFHVLKARWVLMYK